MPQIYLFKIRLAFTEVIDINGVIRLASESTLRLRHAARLFEKNSMLREFHVRLFKGIANVCISYIRFPPFLSVVLVKLI